MGAQLSVRRNGRAQSQKGSARVRSATGRSLAASPAWRRQLAGAGAARWVVAQPGASRHSVPALRWRCGNTVQGHTACRPPIAAIRMCKRAACAPFAACLRSLVRQPVVRGHLASLHAPPLTCWCAGTVSGKLEIGGRTIDAGTLQMQQLQRSALACAALCSMSLHAGYVQLRVRPWPACGPALVRTSGEEGAPCQTGSACGAMASHVDHQSSAVRVAQHTVCRTAHRGC